MAVIRGAEGWEDREASGHAQANGFQHFLTWPQGIPSADPCRRVLSRLETEALPPGFIT